MGSLLSSNKGLFPEGSLVESDLCLYQVTVLAGSGQQAQHSTISKR